jgi:hypothetical protein
MEYIMPHHLLYLALEFSLGMHAKSTVNDETGGKS